MFTTPKITVLLGCCLFCMPPMVGHAADEPADDEAQRCVPLSSISSTEVVDERNILFYMRGGSVYVNRLPNRCPALRRERTFMYRTSMPQLCDLDIITVLDNIGFGFTPGPSCGLGRFYPVSRQEAAAMKNSSPDRIEMKDPEPAEVEDIDDVE